jgi:hypothetical protein
LIARTPFYYGWVVLAAGTLGLMMTLPGRTAAISVFLDPIIGELGLSRGLAAGLFLAGTLLGSATMTFFGRAFDRWGTRKGVAATVVLFAAACVGMGWVAGPLTLLLGFFALRALGQGALWLVSQVAINQWFVARRGFALGLAGVGLAVANAAFPIAIQAMTAAVGWRGAYVLLGVLLLAVMLPVGALFFRRSARDIRARTGRTRIGQRGCTRNPLDFVVGGAHADVLGLRERHLHPVRALDRAGLPPLLAHRGEQPGAVRRHRVLRAVRGNRGRHPARPPDPVQVTDRCPRGSGRCPSVGRARHHAAHTLGLRHPAWAELGVDRRLHLCEAAKESSKATPQKERIQ